VIPGPGGVLYGNQCEEPATTYSLTPPTSTGGSWTVATLYSFSGPCASGLGIGRAGELYGTTKTGIYKLAPPTSAGGAWTYELLYDFNSGKYGSAISNGVVVGPEGVLYGSTHTDSGTIYSLTPPKAPGGAWAYATLYTFTGGSDGSGPAGLMVGPHGILIGTTNSGALGYGTAYSLAPPNSPGGSWVFATLYSFTGADGALPSGLVFGKGGVLYGSLYNGVSPACIGCGAVFSLTPPGSPGGSWTYATIYSFPTSAGGEFPSPVVAGPEGTLFGTTGSGGTFGTGTIFVLAPPASAAGSWTETTLWTFADGGASAYPEGSLFFGPGGSLYGMTFNVGIGFESGTVYSFTP